ncbi:CU044_2847 family protein [Streptomyces sp. NBC_01613]|uniref:CU044_2847 family protein n=2 Tax=Streptomyces sp. NBC_01613 TaxID=2975896 RepID=UPI00386FAB85
MVLMGDVNLTFDDGSVVRLHLTPAPKDFSAMPEPGTSRRETDASEPLGLPADFGSAQPVSVNERAAQALTRGGEALAEALRPLGGVLDGIHQSFTESARRPNEVTVEFGVTLGSDFSLGVFSGKGEASFTVSATWNFTDSPDGVPVPEEPRSPNRAAANGAASPASS